MKRTRLTAIVSHLRPHLEELLSIYCFLSEHFREENGKRFSYLSRTKVLFWDDLPEGTTREEWEEEGYMFIGRWGGKYDEHETTNEARKDGESAVTLVAKDLGACMDSKIKKLIEWTSARDQNLGESVFEMPAVLKLMNDFSHSPDVIWAWVVTAFEALYDRGDQHFTVVSLNAGTLWGEFVNEWLAIRSNVKKQYLSNLLKYTEKVGKEICGTPFELHAAAEAISRWGGREVAREWAFQALDVLWQQAEDFSLVAARDFNAAKVYKVEVAGKKFSVVVADSASLQFSRYARSSHGCYAGVVIVRNLAGNVVISSNTKLELDLSKAAGILRLQEMKARGTTNIVPNAERLCAEGTMPGCEEWYFFAKGRMLLNGSTTKTRRPTALGLETIFRALIAGLGAKVMPTSVSR